MAVVYLVTVDFSPLKISQMNSPLVCIETTGCLKKEVRLTNLQSNTLPHSFVLESLNPFPGYYSAFEADTSGPRSLFFVLKKEYSFEDIASITKIVKQSFPHDFNASWAEIFLRDSKLPCIRIKYLKSFMFIPEIQTLFAEQGIQYRTTKPFDELVLIRVKKSFYVREALEGVYQDLDEESKFYIDLPKSITWEQFKEVTYDVKNNLRNNLFDAALGRFYRHSGIVFAVRIYDKEEDLGRIQTLRKMYWERMERI